MVIAISSDAVRANAEQHPTGALVTDFIGQRGVTSDGPSGYLVEVPSGYEIRPHFHGVNQYQVIARGAAKLGRHPMTRGDFHYADGHTPYGPILAGEGGMSFFTLRQTAYDGFHEMPQSRHLMRPSAHRTFVQRVDPDAARESGSVRLTALGDGTSAYQLTAGPGGRLTIPAVNQGGAFVLVMSGAVRFEGAELPGLSCAWIGPGDPAPLLVATEDGAVAVFLSYSRSSNDGVK
jgi:hypothetical protein